MVFPMRGTKWLTVVLVSWSMSCRGIHGEFERWTFQYFGINDWGFPEYELAGSDIRVFQAPLLVVQGHAMGLSPELTDSYTSVRVLRTDAVLEVGPFLVFKQPVTYDQWAASEERANSRVGGSRPAQAFYAATLEESLAYCARIGWQTPTRAMLSGVLRSIPRSALETDSRVAGLDRQLSSYGAAAVTPLSMPTVRQLWFEFVWFCNDLQRPFSDRYRMRTVEALREKESSTIVHHPLSLELYSRRALVWPVLEIELPPRDCVVVRSPLGLVVAE